MRFNDPAKLMQRCPQLRLFLSNGQLASSLFDRHIWPSLRLQPNAPSWSALPSTSPANAAQSTEKKFKAWQAAFGTVVAVCGNVRARASTR